MVTKLSKTNIKDQLNDATSALLEQARRICWNKISDNTCFLLSEIIHDGKNDFDRRHYRKLNNDQKTPKSLNEITFEIENIFENLYDVNLYIYRSQKHQTIIEIQYYPKSTLDSEFREKVECAEPMLHCKIDLPMYAQDNDQKFDVNWPLGGTKHRWKEFCYLRKFKK
jgi:hypothetical protein